MRELFRGVAAIVAGLLGAAIAWSSAMGQTEPPTRVGRLAFVDGTVSFHDDRQAGWNQAIVNTPLTTGDALWTEPGAHSEISVAGTRVRLDSATQLDMLALDDSQTRLQLAQGRIDIKTFDLDTRQPYQIVTPRGTISLQQQGDYYVEAGSTEDPTRLGVRSGAAQIESLNGQVLAVRAGEVGEVLDDSGVLQLRTIRTAPPPQPAYWANRDRQIVYDPPQYVSAGMVGYEDLNAYGDWINDGGYGRVWVPRAVPSGWAPYRTGHWAYVEPWGWTWIDEQPWGFAPYHYGRWANSRGRWVWVPPQREPRPVYAPALVAFVGGVELAVTLGSQSAAPVGWFPLGPREVYVPPYTTNRDYYRRLNRSARIDERILEDRWQRVQRQEAEADRRAAWANQRFATVMASTDFVRSQPVSRAALQVAPEKIAAAPVAPVAAPPAPTASVLSAKAAPAAPSAELKSVDVPVAKTAVAAMPALAKPASTEARSAPGPKTATVQPQAAPDGDKRRPALPPLAPRQGAAPAELKGTVTPAPAQPPRQQQAAPQPQAAPTAPQPQAPARGAEPPKPSLPTTQPKPAEPAKPAAPQPQARPEAPRAVAPQQQPRPEPPKTEPPKQQAAPQPQVRPEQPHPPAAQQQTRPEPPRPIEPPRQQAAPPPPQAPQQRQAEPPRPQIAPQPQRPAPPQQAAPPPQQQVPQRQAAPPPQQQAPQRQAPPPQQQPAPPRPPEQAQSPRSAPQSRSDDRKDDKK